MGEEKEAGANRPLGYANELHMKDPREHRRRSNFYQDHSKTSRFVLNTVKGTVLSAIEKSDVPAEVVCDMAEIAIREAKAAAEGDAE